MDDRNLVAVAEQAAATSKVQRGPFEGATVKGDDGRVFLGCRLEYDDPALDTDALTNALGAGRVQGMRKAVRCGLYSPVEGELPEVPVATLRRLEAFAAPDLVIIFSSGRGEYVEKKLTDLLAGAGR